MKITSRKEVERGQKGKGKRQEKMRKKENARYERLGVKEKKNIDSKRHLCSHVLCSITHNSQHLETIRVNFNGSRCGVYTYTTEYYSTMRGKESLPFVTTWMDLEGVNTCISGTQ